MSLPQFLSGTYMRYKSDTDSFTTWLAKTAEACTKANSLPPPFTPAEDSTKYKIALQDLASLSQIIAKHGADITIPPTIISSARRAILFHRRFGNRLRAKADDTLGKEGDMHFIRVLEQVLQILGVSEETSTMSAALIADENTLDATANQFSTLNLEEPVELEDDTTPPAEKPKYELEDDFGDDLGTASVACFCLLENLKHIRDFLSDTWSDYKDRKVDLMSASVTTNTALVLARQAIEQAEKVPGFPIGQGIFQSVVYKAICFTSGQEPYVNDNLNTAMLGAAEFCYLRTDILLRSYCETLSPNSIHQYNKRHFGTYDPTKDRKEMSAEDKLTEDTVVLMQALPAFTLIAKLEIPNPAEDEFTRGVREMVNTKSVSLWLSFAAQVYIDIHNILRADVSRGFQELRLSGLRVKSILDDHFSFSHTLSSPNWPKENDKCLKDIQDTIDTFIAKDVFSATKAVPVAKEDQPSFLEWHPLQAGLLVFHINLRMRYLGVSLVNQWGSVIYLAYLYNTLQKEAVISVDWPDMDRIIKYHTEERIFNGRKSEDFMDSLERLTVILLDSAGLCDLEASTTISKVFFNRYVENGSLDLSVANISRLLNDLAQSDVSKKSQSGPHVSGFLKRKWQDTPNLTPLPHASELLKRKWQDTQTLTLLQLLTALRERLIDEESRLIFNYFGIHKRGLELMRLVRIAVNDELTKYFGQQYIEEEYQLPSLSYYIHLAAQPSAASRRMGLALPGSQPTSTPIHQAGQVIQEYLQVNGSVACKELRAFCKNEKRTREEAVKERNRREDNAQFWFTLEESLHPKMMASLQDDILKRSSENDGISTE